MEVNKVMIFVYGNSGVLVRKPGFVAFIDFGVINTLPMANFKLPM